MKLKTLDFQGTGIIFTADGWLNATASALALGKDRLDNFLTSKGYSEYADEVAEECSLKISDLKKVVVGKGKEQGTYLHPEMAMVFARWISPKFARWCDRQIAALIRKAEGAPARNLAARTKRMEQIGQSAVTIAQRNEGVPVRLGLTSQLQASGVRGSGFGDCTRAIYMPLFGGGTEVIRQKYSVPAKANVRDYMGQTSLAAVSLSEAISAERIKSEGAYGNLACEQICNQVGQSVAKMVVGARKGIAL